MKGKHGLMSMIHPPNISAFVDDKNHQIVKNFASILLDTKLKALRHDCHLYTFRNIMLASLLKQNEYTKCVEGETDMIKIALL